MPKICISKYKAAMYLRLSRDDGDKSESDSISNQRELILDYVSKKEDIEIIDEMIDDGYSGSNFERPGFEKLLQAIKHKNINCIIVKDLSRFSRDYIGSGMYIMNLFPKWGVRLIAINDSYDSINPLTANDELMFSFKSIVNDIYLRDISIKIRSHLEVKRKKGEYIGAFVAYGYLKSSEDKHSIIIDENVSVNIKNIFHWKIEGLSPFAIAGKLNDLGILSPAEYKKAIGSKHAGFQSVGTAKWSAQTIQRILKNEIYTGTLAQGKKTTINHKIKKMVDREKENWAVVENAHPAIISKEIYQTANEIMLRDTRAASKNAKSYIFSGLLFCADCKDSMVRRISKYKDSEYVYYRCSTQKGTGGCFNHNIREDAIYDMVLKTINEHIRCIIGLEKAISMMSESDLNRNNKNKLDKIIQEKEAEIKKRKHDVFCTHQSLADGIITKDEFKEFKAIYDQQISDAEKSICRLREEQKNFENDSANMCLWMKEFIKYGTVQSLDHKMLVLLIDKIFVYNKNSIHIVFKYQNEFERVCQIANATDRMRELMVYAG